jgi:hypothetical protein
VEVILRGRRLGVVFQTGGCFFITPAAAKLGRIVVARGVVVVDPGAAQGGVPRYRNESGPGSCQQFASAASLSTNIVSSKQRFAGTPSTYSLAMIEEKSRRSKLVSDG